MDILISMRKRWSDMIFRGEKTFEFRNFNPKNFTLDDKIYIYESKQNGGCGEVVGYFKTDSIVKIEPGIAESYFLPYFCEHVLGDSEKAKKFERAANIKLTNYKRGIPVIFALDDEAISFMEKNDDWPPFKMENATERAETEIVISKCDKWLTDIGFFNNCGESNYSQYLTIIEPIQFNESISLEKFCGLNGKPIKKAPQSWQYIL